MNKTNQYYEIKKWVKEFLPRPKLHISTIYGLWGCLGISFQYILTLLAPFNIVFGFLISITFILNPVIFGIFAMLGAKKGKKTLHISVILGLISITLSIYYYYHYLLVFLKNMPHFLLTIFPIISLILVSISAIIRYFTNSEGIKEIFLYLSAAVGSFLIYFSYIILWLKVIFEVILA